MIYRKTPPHPPRMLLRVVAAAGASAVVVGAGACGSTAGPEALGVIDSGWEVTCANGCGLVDGSGGGVHQEAGVDAGGEGGLEGGEAGGGDAGAAD